MVKVFVAGSTGVLGRRAVALLVAEGHQVTGIARSPEKADVLRRSGATPVTVDLFDPAALRSAVAGHDVVCNLATHVPTVTSAVRPGAWDENNRIRTEGSRNLVDAALAAGASRYVQESISFIYPDRGDEWIDESVEVEVSPYAEPVLAAEANARRFTEGGGTGVVLRFAMFYGPDSHTSRDSLRMARHGVGPTPGAPGAWHSSIATDDAASAVVAALRASAGIYNVGDDEPLTKRDLADAWGAAAGVPKVFLTPPALQRLAGSKLAPLARSQRVSNARFKAATGWAPAFRSAREGVPAAVRDMRAVASAPLPVRLAARVLLALSGLSSLMLGLYALAAPHSFYTSFPGGRGWVAADGPYNEHLVRDFGGLNLGLAIVLLVAAALGTKALARTAAVAGLAFAGPHLVYHLAHLDVYGGADKAGNVISLSGSVIMLAAALVLSSSGRPAGHPEVAPAP